MHLPSVWMKLVASCTPVRFGLYWGRTGFGKVVLFRMCWFTDDLPLNPGRYWATCCNRCNKVSLYCFILLLTISLAVTFKSTRKMFYFYFLNESDVVCGCSHKHWKRWYFPQSGRTKCDAECVFHTHSHFLSFSFSHSLTHIVLSIMQHLIIKASHLTPSHHINTCSPWHVHAATT